MKPHAVRAFAPGRVNLIGEHTDYNDGLCLPFAIELGVTVTAECTTAARSPAGCLRDDPYLRGAVAELRATGIEPPGCVLEVTSDLPAGAGLSSSAALCVALTLALCGVAGATPPAPRRARPPLLPDRERVRRCRDGSARPARVVARRGRPGGEARHAHARVDARRARARRARARRARLRRAARARRARATTSAARSAGAAAELLGLESLRDARDGAGLPGPARPPRAPCASPRTSGSTPPSRHSRRATPRRSAGSSTRRTAACATTTRYRSPRSSGRSPPAATPGALGARIMGGGFGGSVLALFPPAAALPAGAIRVRAGRGARILC